MKQNSLLESDKYKNIITFEQLKKSNFTLVTYLKVFFVLKGTLELNVNGNKKVLRTGNIFILNQGDLVKVLSEGYNNTMIIIIEEDIYTQKNDSFQLNQPLSYLYMKEAYEQIAKTISAIYLESLYSRDGYDYMVESYLKRLYGLFVRYIPISKEVNPSNSKEAADKINEIMNYLTVNYSEKIMLDSLAEKFFINKYYLSHLFKEQLDMTIGDYIKEVRLSQSEKDLLRTNNKLMDVALQHGFPNAKALTQAFKEKYGMTPSQFRKENRKVTKEAESIEVAEVEAEILTHFIEDADIESLQPHNIKLISKKLNMNKIAFRNEKRDYVIKSRSNKLDNLSSLTEFGGNHFIGITDSIKLLEISYKDDSLTIHFHQLDERIRKIINQGYDPYIQLQVLDYEQFIFDYPFGSDNLFIEVLNRLKNHLVNQYSDFSQWHVEIRCFHESDDRVSLCDPLFKALPYYKDYTNLVIHFPVFPSEVSALESDESSGVYCINDYTEIRRVDFERALSHLKAEKYNQIINEQKNSEYQEQLLQRIKEYEQDDYLSRYSEMIQAIITMWNYIRTKQEKNHFISPISLDATKPFEYFPVDLAKRFSLYTEEGFITENWYAHKFISHLFQDVVFRNEYCIVTKYHDNYKMLMLYPEEEVLHYLDRKKERRTLFSERSLKQPYMQLNLELSGIEGTYKIIRQSMNREVIDQKLDIRNLRYNSYISNEDITYHNRTYAPTRRVQEVSVDNHYTLEVSVPILGFEFIELNKIK